MTKDELKERLTKFALRIIALVDKMPNTIAGNAIAKQIIRSGTSPSANYRAACLGKSDKDFINKLKMVEEELDETCHWIELIIRSEMVKPNLLKDLYNEGIELSRIITKTIISTKVRLDSDKMSK
ncbi:MAG: four helix bundle protein [Bacteroidales bacterium]|nr:four helix bundle protein [Bacteroidales bacterium]